MLKKNNKKKKMQVWGQTFQPSGESSKNPQTKCANFMAYVTAGAQLRNTWKNKTVRSVSSWF